MAEKEDPIDLRASFPELSGLLAHLNQRGKGKAFEGYLMDDKNLPANILLVQCCGRMYSFAREDIIEQVKLSDGQARVWIRKGSEALFMSKVVVDLEEDEDLGAPAVCEGSPVLVAKEGVEESSKDIETVALTTARRWLIWHASSYSAGHCNVDTHPRHRASAPDTLYIYDDGEWRHQPSVFCGQYVLKCRFYFINYLREMKGGPNLVEWGWRETIGPRKRDEGLQNSGHLEAIKVHFDKIKYWARRLECRYVL